MTEQISIHPVNPEPRKLQRVADVIRRGGLVVCPTDSCYAFGFHMGDKAPIKEIQRIRQTDKKHNFTFTRYADDLTFSANEDAKADLGKILWIAHKIVEEEGFIMHPDKLRIMHHGRQQEVTGIVVNEKLNVSRKHLKNFRALLFQIERDGFKGKTWNNTKNMRECIQGYSNFVYMVNPEKGRELKARVRKILNV